MVIPTRRSIVIAAALALSTAGPAAAAPSSVTLWASPNPARYGQAVTLTATVSPTAATGKVTFYQGVSVVGIAPVVLGTATLTIASLAAGSGALTAYYGGESGNAASRSAQVPMAVNSLAAQGFQDLFERSIEDATGLQFPALAAGDFNGDGKLDLAATGALPGASTMVILLGNGDGTFQLGKKYAISGSAVLAADFNGDGRLDLAVLSGDGTLAMMLGNGDGTFQGPVDTAVHGEWMAAADFNGDGVVDLAVAELAYRNGGVSILLGKGDGTFAAPISIPVASGSAIVAIADFNGDGMPDLALLQETTSFQIYLGKGDGTFTPQGSPMTVTVQIFGMAAGDFNGDGRMDLAIGHNAGISLFEGNGDGTMGAVTFTNIGRPPLQLAVTDVNGDGNLDVIAETEYPLDTIDGTWGSFAVLIGDGTGGLTLNPYHDNGSGYAPFVVGDFNGDGRVDLVEGFLIPVAYLALAPADLAVSLTYSGNPTQGLSLTSTVANLGPAAFTGQVVETFQVSDGLTITSLMGAGWSCTILTCARSDGLAAGASFPPVTATVTMAETTRATQSVTASLQTEWMSDPNPANDTVTDVIKVLPRRPHPRQPRALQPQKTRDAQSAHLQAPAVQ